MSGLVCLNLRETMGTAVMHGQDPSKDMPEDCAAGHCGIAEPGLA